MVLIIYNDQICKEILMPNMYNTDYQIRLDASDYGLKKDIVLKLERGESEWKIVGTNEYWITMRDGVADSRSIAKDDLIRIDTRSGDHLIILAADVPITFQTMEKYDLRGIDKVTIGRSDDNTIVYSFQALISGVHAELQRRGNEWVLLDKSRNGIYCRNLRVKNSHIMQFGETVEFFGLHLMVNGQVLMVGANCGTLKVSEKLPGLAIDPYTPQSYESISEKKNAYFNRAPRKLPVLYREKIQIDEPPVPAAKEKKPAYMVIGPAFTMAIPMLPSSAYGTTNAVNHIDIRVSGTTNLSLTFAYGTYYLPDGTEIIIDKDHPYTYTATNYAVTVKQDDLMRSEIETYKVNADGSTTPLDDMFYVTGYSDNGNNSELSSSGEP